MIPGRKDEHGNYPKFTFEYKGRTIYLHENLKRSMDIINRYCREVNEVEESWRRNNPGQEDEPDEENPSCAQSASSSTNIPISTSLEQISLQQKLDDEEFVDYDEDRESDQEVKIVRIDPVQKEVTDLTEIEFVLPHTTSDIPIINDNITSNNITPAVNTENSSGVNIKVESMNSTSSSDDQSLCSYTRA